MPSEDHRGAVTKDLIIRTKVTRSKMSMIKEKTTKKDPRKSNKMKRNGPKRLPRNKDRERYPKDHTITESNFDRIQHHTTPAPPSPDSPQKVS